MELERKDNLSNLISQLQALSTLRNEYFSLMLFIADIKDVLENSYNTKTCDYEQEGVDKVLKIIDSQIDGYYRTSEEISNENYFLNLLSKTLSERLQNEIMILN